MKNHPPIEHHACTIYIYIHTTYIRVRQDIHLLRTCLYPSVDVFYRCSSRGINSVSCTSSKTSSISIEVSMQECTIDDTAAAAVLHQLTNAPVEVYVETSTFSECWRERDIYTAIYNSLLALPSASSASLATVRSLGPRQEGIIRSVQHSGACILHHRKTSGALSYFY